MTKENGVTQQSMITNTKHHFTAASLRKQDRYGPLLQDLQDSVSSVDLVTIEINCLGHFTPETISKLSEICHLPKRTVHVCSTLQQVAKVALIEILMQDSLHIGTLLNYWTNICIVLRFTVCACVFVFFFFLVSLCLAGAPSYIFIA